jgi:hypothetical protein
LTKAEDLTGGVSQVFTLRFYLVDLLPSVLLALLVLVLWDSGAPFERPSLEELSLDDRNIEGWQIALFLLGVLAMAVILQPFQLALVQFLEGYWGPSRLEQRLAQIGVELQRRRWRELNLIAESPQAIGHAGPTPDWVLRRRRLYPRDRKRLLPTRLGNTLRASEDRAGGRYGLSTVAVWPRLYPQLAGPLATAIGETRDQLDTAARLSVILGLTTLVAAGLLLPTGLSWLLLAPVGTAVLAWLAYQAAIRAAEQHGAYLDAAFDLHRFDLVRQLHFELPRTAQGEHKLNRDISRFFQMANEQTEKRRNTSLKPNRNYDHGERVGEDATSAALQREWDLLFAAEERRSQQEASTSDAGEH